MPVELTWSAPPECPTRAAVLARVRELASAATNNAPLVRAEGEIRKIGAAFELRLLTEQEGQRGERLVRSAQCEDLRGVAAVSLVLLLTSGRQPDDTTSSSSSTDGLSSGPAEETPKPPPAPPAPEPAVEPEPEPAAEGGAGGSTFRWLLAAPQLALQVGPLPRPTPALSVGLGFEVGRWSLRVLGQWAVKQRIAAPLSIYGAEAQRATVGLWACGALGGDRLSFAPCLQGSVSRLTATGYGPFLVPSSQHQATWAVGAGAIARARLTGSLALMVAVGGQVELKRPDLRLSSADFDETVGPVRRLAPVSGQLVVGPEWIF